MLKACAAKNMGVTLMKMNPALTNAEEAETLARLRERYKNQSKELPEALTKLAKVSEDRGAADRSLPEKIRPAAGPSSRATRPSSYCLNRPEVHCVCPSINSFEELDAYIAIVRDALRGPRSRDAGRLPRDASAA